MIRFNSIIKPEGFADLVKVSFLGDTILIDYADQSLAPVGPVNYSPELVIKYLVDEGFLIPLVKEESN